MTNFKSILYITNILDPDESNKQLKHLLSVLKYKINEIIYMQNTSNLISLDGISSNKIKTKILYEKRFIPLLILRTIEQEDVSLIVINFGGKKKAEEKSLMKELIGKITKPLLFCNFQNINKSNKNNIFDKTIFATNWSLQSEYALNYILSIKKILGTLDIVYVINKKLTIKDLRELKKELAKMRKVCQNKKIDAESHIYAGKITDEIILSAKDYKSTIIVLSRASKYRLLNKFLNRQISYKVAERASIPVLVV